MGMNFQVLMEKYYEEINKLKPTYEEIKEFVGMLEDTYGIVTYTKRDDNPLIIRLHDTWRKKFGGKLHIDIISGEFHLMLDKKIVLEFVNFIKRGRKKKH